MPLSVTLGELTYRAQSRADMIGQNFVSSGEWTRFANSAYTDLYDKVSQADPERYLEDLTITVTSGSYALPGDFYKLLRVDLLYGASNPAQFYTLRKFNLQEEDSFQYPAYTTAYGPAFRYRLRDGAIVFTPTPALSQQIRLLYLPRISPLVTSADTVDGINGWEEAIVLDMAIMALLKENATDVSQLVAERNKWNDKITALAAERDISFPEQTIDVNRGPWPFRWGSGGWEGP